MYFITIFFKQIRYQLLFILLIFINFCFIHDISAQENTEYTLKTVVIDAGHGGKDPGTSGVYAKEKDIALAIALKVGTYIEENIPEVKVIYTRTTDVFVPLHERAEIANKNKADLFMSIHVDGHQSKQPFGTSTYVMGLHKTQENLELAKKENAAILLEEDYTAKYEGFDPTSAESYIMFSFLQNTFLDQSLNYAAFVENEFQTRALRKSRGVKQAGFLVLWKTTMPSVLIETGYLTNPREEKYLSSSNGQDYIASAIYRAFKSYKKAIEDKSNFATLIEKEIDTDTDLAPVNVPVNDTSEIFFKIQIASSSNSVSTSPEQFKGLENVEELKIDNIYKYTVGSSSNYADIIKFKKDIEDKFPDAFIIAVAKTGRQIPVNEALKLKNN